MRREGERERVKRTGSELSRRRDGRRGRGRQGQTSLRGSKNTLDSHLSIFCVHPTLIDITTR